MQKQNHLKVAPAPSTYSPIEPPKPSAGDEILLLPNLAEDAAALATLHSLLTRESGGVLQNFSRGMTWLATSGYSADAETCYACAGGATPINWTPSLDAPFGAKTRGELFIVWASRKFQPLPAYLRESELGHHWDGRPATPTKRPDARCRVLLAHYDALLDFEKILDLVVERDVLVYRDELAPDAAAYVEQHATPMQRRHFDWLNLPQKAAA